VKIIKTFSKFAVVGAAGAVINMAVFNSLMFITFFNRNYILTNTIGFIVAVSNNFYWNNKWTYKSAVNNKKTKHKFIQFFMIGVATLAVNTSLVHYFVESLSVNKRIANLLSIILCSVISFAANSLITFKDKASKT
jgi:dolichol-phosphate mannosyltransferase